MKGRQRPNQTQTSKQTKKWLGMGTSRRTTVVYEAPGEFLVTLSPFETTDKVVCVREVFDFFAT